MADHYHSYGSNAVAELITHIIFQIRENRPLVFLQVICLAQASDVGQRLTRCEPAAAAMTNNLDNTITDTIQLLVEQGVPTAITLQAWSIGPVTFLPFTLAWVGLLALLTAVLWWHIKRRRIEHHPDSH